MKIYRIRLFCVLKLEQIKNALASAGSGECGMRGEQACCTPADNCVLSSTEDTKPGGAGKLQAANFSSGIVA